MEPIAYQTFRYGLVATAICFAVGAALTKEARVIAMRCFCGGLGISLVGWFVYYAAITIDETENKRYGTAVWMAGWTALIGFLMFTAFRTAIKGFV